MGQIKAKQPKNRFSKYLTEGVIIALVPLVAYGMKFIYEYSYGRYFAIPPELISFSLPSVFPTLIIVLLFIGFIIYQVGTVFHYRDTKMNYLQIVFQNVGILIILTALTFTIAPNKPYVLFFLVPALFLILRHFVLPLLWHRKTKGYINKTNEHFKDILKSTDTFVDDLFNFGMYKISAIPILFIGLCILTGIYGYQSAKSQEKFWVDSTDNNVVAVKFADNRAVFIRVDDNNKMAGEFWVRDLTASNLILRKEHIGKITK